MSELFVSAEQMQQAVNYNRWTFDQFAKYLKGDILEVGCGVGSFTKLIASDPKCNSLYAIDISKPAIDLISSSVIHDKVKIALKDFMEVTGSFDCIICMNVMEHVEDDNAFFQKLLSSLKINGILFLLVPSHSWLYNRFDKEAGHFRRYNKKIITDLKIPKGFQLLDQYYFNMVGALGYWFFYKVMKNQPENNPKNSIGFFDRVVVPISRFLLPRKVPLGISLISVVKRLN